MTRKSSRVPTEELTTFASAPTSARAENVSASVGRKYLSVESQAALAAEVQVRKWRFHGQSGPLLTPSQ
jgi:hypothetical protein